MTAPRARLPGPLDLSPPRQMLTARANAVIHDTLGRIPGLVVKDVKATRASAQTTCVTVNVRGWGPTLHEAQGALMIRLPAPADEHSITGDEISDNGEFQRFARVQALRAEAGMEMGLSAPMDPTGGSIPMDRIASIRRRMPTEVRHLLVDASLPSVLATAGEDPLGDLRDGIRRAHAGGGNLVHGGDHRGVHFCGDIWLQEVSADVLGIEPRVDRTLRIVGRAAVLEVPEGMTGSYDGRHLRLQGHGVPETVATVMPGMRLGDVVDLHPVLSERIVDDVEIAADGEMWIGLVPDLLPLTEAVQMVVDAIED